MTCLAVTSELSPGEPPAISPYYFGPNAFPVPDICEKTNPYLKVELAGEYFRGARKDDTYDIIFKTDIPVFTPRVNLSLWWQMMEWYSVTPAYLDICGVAQDYHRRAQKGKRSGDIYVATSIQLLTEGKFRPGWVIRAALKTASGGGFNERRFYDSPGYFFDTAISKRFNLSSVTSLWIDFAVSTGFLCWQTGVSSQNDALMYGVKLGMALGRFYFSGEYGGYSGWQHSNKHLGEVAFDQPSRFKLYFSYNIKRMEIKAGLIRGLHDYPYTGFEVGLAYEFNIYKYPHNYSPKLIQNENI